jgi:tetratricopeptide repeat protein
MLGVMPDPDQGVFSDELLERVSQLCREMLGQGFPGTVGAAQPFAVDLSALDEFKRIYSEKTLAQSRQELGDDHLDTLVLAHDVAVGLRAAGDYERARLHDEDTLSRRRRALGEDHPDTLSSARSLVIDLSALGDYPKARQLGEDTLTCHRRVLGADAAHTLRSAHQLANDLRALGEHQQARLLDAAGYWARITPPRCARRTISR